MKLTVKFEIEDEAKTTIDTLDFFNTICKLEDTVKGMSFYIKDLDLDSQCVYEVQGCVGSKESLSGKYKEAAQAILTIYEKELRQKQHIIKRIKGIKIEQ